MTMTHQLTGLRSRRGEPQPIDDIVQAAFQNLKQQGTGDALATFSFVKRPAELLLKQAIEALDLLLFTQLGAVFGKFGTGLSMLTGSIAAALNGAFIRVAPLPLEK